MMLGLAAVLILLNTLLYCSFNLGLISEIAVMFARAIVIGLSGSAVEKNVPSAIPCGPCINTNPFSTVIQSLSTDRNLHSIYSPDDNLIVTISFCLYRSNISYYSSYLDCVNCLFTNLAMPS